LENLPYPVFLFSYTLSSTSCLMAT